MAIATSLAIAGLASAGGSLVKGIMQSKGAKAAAKEQQKAISQAEDYQRQSMGQIGQLYAPYINAAQSSALTRSRLTTPGAGAKFASPGPPNATPQFMGGGQPGQAVPRGGTPPPGPPGQGGPPMGGGPGGPPPPGRRPPPGMMPPAGAPGGMQTMVQTADGQVRPMPPGMAQQMFQSGMARPVQGPYPMAEGGDFNVDQPTMFLAGEAGPERATFSGAQQPQWTGGGLGGGGGGQALQGWGGFGSMLSQMRSPNSMPPPGQKPLPRGLATRPGSLPGAMMGGMGAAGANMMRSMGPMAGLFGGGGGRPAPPPMQRPGSAYAYGGPPMGFPGFAGGSFDPSGGGASMGGGGQYLPMGGGSGAMGVMGGLIGQYGGGNPGAMRGGPGPYGGPSGGFMTPRQNPPMTLDESIGAMGGGPGAGGGFMMGPRLNDAGDF
jgi:hypothetical protein